MKPFAAPGVVPRMSSSLRETPSLRRAGICQASTAEAGVRVHGPASIAPVGGLVAAQRHLPAWVLPAARRLALLGAVLGTLSTGMARAELSTSAAPGSDSKAAAAVADGTPADGGADATAEPAGPTHRYARIPKRNAFGIKPPAPPPAPEPEKEPPKDRPEFFLTGFTTVRGEKRAFVAYQPKGKPVQYPRALIPDEEVGIGDGGVLKLVSIDPVEKTVTIAYNGEEIPLNFKDNAVKVTGTTAAPAPGAPGQPPGGLKGSQPPPPVLNTPANVGGVPGAPGMGGFPGGVPGGMAPTVIGRGGAVLSGGSPTLQATPFAPNAIPAGVNPVPNAFEVPAVAPAPNEYGGTVPVNPTRRPRTLTPPPPAPFPGLP